VQLPVAPLGGADLAVRREVEEALAVRRLLPPLEERQLVDAVDRAILRDVDADGPRERRQDVRVVDDLVRDLSGGNVRTAAWLLAAASIAAPGVSAEARRAQAGRTDFSGRWTLVPEPAGTPAARATPGMGTGWGPEISIAQDAKALTIEFPTFARGDMQPPTRLVYLLDGSQSRNTINSGRGPQEQVATATNRAVFKKD
jgi:hypothetical protein